MFSNISLALNSSHDAPNSYPELKVCLMQNRGFCPEKLYSRRQKSIETNEACALHILSQSLN